MVIKWLFSPKFYSISKIYVNLLRKFQALFFLWNYFPVIIFILFLGLTSVVSSFIPIWEYIYGE